MMPFSLAHLLFVIVISFAHVFKAIIKLRARLSPKEQFIIHFH